MFFAQLIFPFEYKVGLEKSSTRTCLRLNGSKQTSFVPLANLDPLQVIAPELINLIDGGPLVRRQMLDWGVFHVEHRFHDEWKLLQKSLRQRNALLRRGRNIDLAQLDAWDEKLVSVAEKLHSMRSHHFALFLPYVQQLLSSFEFSDDISFEYLSGWNNEADYREQLYQAREVDQLRGYTTIGPHKADIKIKLGNSLAKEICSRGQKKLLSSMLKLAQIQMLRELNNKTCLVLVDDLPSELDEKHCRLLCEILETMQSQVFVSCIESDDLVSYINMEESKLFHVEHGALSTIMSDSMSTKSIAIAEPLGSGELDVRSSTVIH